MHSLIEQNATALGFEVVEVERAPQGLLRISIDRPQGEGAVTVGDCERLSDQLTHVFMVENVDYARLEVSSPGVDRPLVKPADFVRFAGAEITLKLRTMVGGQRKFEGVLQTPEGEDFAIEFDTPGGRSQLRFKFADVEKARLVPKLDFKRKTR
ncbi:ribosome maturation factor RimP [Derxia lacustris]|uniref:ribosome maturation factor RimP n=1 Tax=Derxia lacustris TaxID=764842 RepID=UPI00159464D7